jgi:hypothetical protein
VKSRDDYAGAQQEYLKVFDEVRSELLKIPGVVDVGIGLKETNGGLTEEPSFRVYVTNKIPESDLPPEQIVPKTIRGFPTDVIKVRPEVSVIGFNDEDDTKNYSTKVGGIRIENDKGISYGTLGCFCQLTADNSTVVLLSCYHVLYDSGATKGAKVGQPGIDGLCCCTCNQIGAVLDGADKPVDGAIAKLDADVRYYPKIKQIKKADGSLEMNGFISGSGDAVMGEECWKVGSTTGLTRGTISQAVPRIEIHPKAPFGKVCDHGDSGSVVVSLGTSNVIGLLRSMDPGNTLGYATPIAKVLAALKIVVIATDTTKTYDVSGPVDDESDRFAEMARESAFAEVVARLRASVAGREFLRIFDSHRAECLDLINKERRATVTWHRNHGPTYIAAIARSAKAPDYRIPREIDGVSRKGGALAMRTILEQFGSKQLRTDTRAYADVLIEAFDQSDTTDELIQRIAETRMLVLAGSIG